MPGLFSQKNLLLCDMQGTNFGLSVETIENEQNRRYGQPEGFSLLTSTKFEVRAVDCLKEH